MVKYPIYDGLLLGNGKVQEEPVPTHSLDKEVPVVQDKASVYHARRAFAIADGITGSGQNSAKVAEYVVKKFPIWLYDSALSLKDDYHQIYRTMEYILSNIDAEMNKKYDATATFIIGHIRKDRKLLTYRLGDTEARIIRGNEQYHIDQLFTEKKEPLFEGKFLIPEFQKGSIEQAKEYNMPSQVGNCLAHGRFTVHQLEYGDRIIFSSDGFNKPFRDKIEQTIYRIVSQAESPLQAEEKLIRTAVNLGLKDDYSAVVVFNGHPSRKAIIEYKIRRLFDALKGKK